MFDGEIKLSGKHASYLKFLSAKTLQLNKSAPCAAVLRRHVDVYIAGVAIGLAKKLKTQTDNSIADTATIFADAVISEQEKLKVLYRIMQLINDSSLSAEDRIDLAFRYDTDAEYVKKGMELFNSYARGGIQWLYDEITENATTKEDYIENIAEMIDNYYQDYNDSFANQM